MKKLLIATALLVTSLGAYAVCTSNTFIDPSGKMVMCTTCCFGASCTTTCYQKGLDYENI